MISRRDFIVVSSGLALALGEAAAQQPRAVPRIGVLRQPPPSDPQYQAFLLGLRELGYIEGKTVLIDYRYGDLDRFPEFADDLVRSNANVIFAPNPQGAQAARKVTAVIPIVFAVVGDPVTAGLAASLARPGGNVTGLTALGSGLGGKRLSLLKEILPRLSRVAVLWNPAIPDKVIEWKEMQGPARAMKIELQSIEVRAPADFDQAFESARRVRAEALMALGEPLVFSQRGRVIEFTAQARLPAIFAWRETVEAGALISYGPDISDLYRRAATYVDKILRGAKPGDLPIEEPARFDFAVNLKTAKALGVTIPQSVLVRADRVIE